MVPLNPYTPPSDDRRMCAPTEGEPSRPRRDGDRLKMLRKGGRLPPRCVVCNAPGEGERIHQDLTWHPAWIYWTLPVGLVFYWLLSAIFRQSVILDFSLCGEHRRHSDKWLLVSWLGGAFAIVSGIAGLVTQAWSLALLGPLTGIVSSITGAIKARTARVVKLDPHHVWLQVGAPFLQRIDGD
jgi:hypothetical protein